MFVKNDKCYYEPATKNFVKKKVYRSNDQTVQFIVVSKKNDLSFCWMNGLHAADGVVASTRLTSSGCWTFLIMKSIDRNISY
jgi:hypothetical protein